MCRALPFRSALLAAILAAVAPPALAQKVPAEQPYAPTIAAASDEGFKALQTIRPPKGFRAELVAAEPLLATPVAFCIDEKGRFYVAETFRLGSGVTDTRGHMY